MGEEKRYQELHEWITVKEVCRILGVTDRWVRQLISDGLLEARKVGNMWLVNRHSVYEYDRSRGF